MKPIFRLRYTLPTAVAALFAACSSAPPPVAHAPAPPVQLQPPAEAQVTAPVVIAGHAQPSSATNARAYRADAAAHIYAANKERIYKGKMPPLLHAVGVLQVEVDAR